MSRVDLHSFRERVTEMAETDATDQDNEPTERAPTCSDERADAARAAMAAQSMRRLCQYSG